MQKDPEQQQHKQSHQQQKQQHKQQHKTTTTLVKSSDSKPVHLPTSIALSYDGEEGVQAYRRRIKMRNIFSQQDKECFQVPPNRTIMHDIPHDGSLVRAFATTTSSKDDSRLALHRQLEFSSPKHMDYVSSSFLSGWRTEKSSDMFASPQKFSPLQQKSSSTVVPDPNQQAGKQRSSSADSVRKLVARCTFLRLGKKFSGKSSTSNGANKSTKQQPPPPLPLSQLPSLADCSEPECETTVESPPCGTVPWELPPNYVDMIFGKELTSSLAEGGSKVEGIKSESTKLENIYKAGFLPPTPTVAVKLTK